MEGDFLRITGGCTEAQREGKEEDEERSQLFSRLQPYCLQLLELYQNPKKNSAAIPALLHLLRSSPPDSLQPFFDYALFPFLLLLDAAVDCRSSPKRSGSDEIRDKRVSDNVAEGVVECLEALLNKCKLNSVDQMVVILKKLANAALLSPSEASEEFRGGVIKCLRALLLNLHCCSNQSCLCRQGSGPPMLLETRDLQTPTGTLKHDMDQGECLLVFLQSEAASAAVGHWLSLLLKAADTEATRGHRGSADLRVEAFLTLRVLVAKVGTADALAFFLPGVVSQFAKVLHISKTMISGAAGSVEAIVQALRGLAEYLMIVLQDDANLSGVDLCIDTSVAHKDKSTTSLLEELRQLPFKAESKILAERINDNAVNGASINTESGEKSSPDLVNGMGSLHVKRTKEWLEKTAAHVDKLLSSTFPYICVHQAKRVRYGLLAAIRGLLLKCNFTLGKSKLMLLECLCTLVVDDSDEISAAAQEFMEYLFSASGKHHIEHDISAIFSRLLEKLPKAVLRNDESLAVSHAQQLLTVIYYSGPQFLLNHLQSPVAAARFLDVFALCFSQSSAFTGSINKLVSRRPSAIGFLPSVAELKGLHVVSDGQVLYNAASSNCSKLMDIPEIGKQHTEAAKLVDLPRMPPWFVYVGDQKLYHALAGILRLVGLSLIADNKNGHLSIIADIPLGYLRKLVSEVRRKEYTKESWQSWYNQTGSGKLLRQASTAVCILNEMIYGVSDKALDTFRRMFQKSRIKRVDYQESDEGSAGGRPHKLKADVVYESVWEIALQKGARSHFIDCIGKILHEYLCSEVWDLPVDHQSLLTQSDAEFEDITSYFFHDIAILHQVIIDGIGIFALCLGNDFSSSGFLHLSLYLLLENLICSNFEVRNASDSILHLLSTTSGHSTVGHLVLANADYVIDSICRQLRHLDLNPHVPKVLAAMLSFIGVGHKILPLLEEPMRTVSQELEILGRHKHPDLIVPFLKAVTEIAKASKHEAFTLPSQAHCDLMYVKSKISDRQKNVRTELHQGSMSGFTDEIDASPMEPDEWENILFKLNDSKRYRQTVGSIAGSCLTAAAPLLASMSQVACLVALDIIEDGVAALAKVEEAYRHEKETKETIEEELEMCSLYQLKDAMGAADDSTIENRLLPAVNKIWPFLVVCVQQRNTVVVRRCLSVVSSVVQISGGDFFSRRFYTDGPHFWKLLSTSPLRKKPNLKERTPLQLPYRSANFSSEDSVAESSNIKVQVALLNMIADLSQNKRSASALEVVLKKVSSLVVGIACSGVVGLHDASVNALKGLASIDPDLIWLLLADVYYSLKKKELPSPPTSDFPELSLILPPPSSGKQFLYVQYGGQSYGFDVNFSSLETIFKKLQALVFSNQI